MFPAQFPVTPDFSSRSLDTTVYLVFDPTDSLSAAARIHMAGKFIGIPCEVWAVRRLDRQWYAAYFYTNEGWGQCH
jgi:hypothetical protein